MPPTPADLVAFCPRCGAANPGDRGGVPFGCPGCRLTLFFNPAVAAAGFAFDPDGRALFVRRSHDPAKGKLAVPGGFVDFGEAADDALRRETREEVGLELGPLTFLCSAANRYEYRGVVYPVCDLVFTAAAVDPGSARPLDGVSGLVWARPADVDPAELAFPSVRLGWERLTGRPG